MTLTVEHTKYAACKPAAWCLSFVLLISVSSCQDNDSTSQPELESITIDRAQYNDRLQGFWLGACLANWTGLVTEMDKIGNIGEIKTGDFYTRDDWGKPDQPSIWSEGVPSDLSENIDFVFRDEGEVWGADDDTDIEYMYQYLLFINDTSTLSPEQIRDGWLRHIIPEEENYLWVSNQRAFELMAQGMLPPETGSPQNNEHYDMIDAQLTTEIFGLLAPSRPDIALEIAWLPIRTTASGNAVFISEFYITMHSLAISVDTTASPSEQVHWLAEQAREVLPDTSYAAKMYDFVKGGYMAGKQWETVRDEIYQRYQVEQLDGYNLTSRTLYCNGCFAAGINFAASLVSLFYGEGDLVETIKIGTLAGWDSDNPTATWGGLLGFMIGKSGIEEAFKRKFASQYHIHRTRQNFPNDGVDTFMRMAEMGIGIIDKVVVEKIHGQVDTVSNSWIIPKNDLSIH